MTVMKACLSLLCLAVLAGCATSSTLVSRKQEKLAVYEALSPEFKIAVDQGTIKVGMPMEAVFIAWGKPSQVMQSGTAVGEQTIWLYQGGFLQETRYWGRRRLHTDYTPMTYVRAEVIFGQGVVNSWRTLPQPE